MKIAISKNFQGIDGEVILALEGGGKRPQFVPGFDALPEVPAARLEREGATKYKSLTFVTPSKASDRAILAVGVGKLVDLDTEKARVLGATAWAKLQGEHCSHVAVNGEVLLDLLGAERTIAFLEGMALKAYEFTEFKSSPKAKARSLKIVSQKSGKKSEIDLHVKRVEDTIEAVTIARDWSNQPNNVGTPEYYAHQASKLGKQYGLKVKVLEEKEIRKESMNLLMGVGQGSVNRPRVVVVEYTPKKKPRKTLCLVGKGVTFDTGGISLKPGLNMEAMRHDMSGAANVMGAVVLASLRQVENKIIGILGFVENMPDAGAITPGHIIKGRSGTTVEIVNTDAEGRLVMADLVDYAKEFSPNGIVNIATLTGAVISALGKTSAAVLSRSPDLLDQVEQAAMMSDERLWQLPLFDEYMDDVKSEFADIKNANVDGQAGTIRAAVFMHHFAPKGIEWAHIDIAGVAHDNTVFPYYPKRGASGAFVRTLANLAEYYQ